MNRLLLCVVFAGIFAVASANITPIIQIMTGVMQECRDKKEGCKISDDMFRRFMNTDTTVLDEGISNDENKAAWSWVSCLYEQIGTVNEDGVISEDGLDMFLEMFWKGDEKKKTEEIVKGCAKESNEKGTSRAEIIWMFYKCGYEKDIPIPEAIASMKDRRSAAKECMDKYPIGLDDFVSYTKFEPMTDQQGSYTACLAIAGEPEGDEICSCYLPKAFEKIKNEDRRKVYVDAYGKCKDGMEDYQENYHKVNDFEKFKKYVIYMHNCLCEKVDKISMDDFYSEDD